MRVRVCYFAVFRELTGIAEETVETSAVTVRELFEEAIGRHGGLAHEPAALVAINDEMSEWTAPLSENDRVLFFPPVAGG
jgi:molybdopterin converting factor small subunit